MRRVSRVPPGSEVVGNAQDRFGIRLQVVRTPLGDLRATPHMLATTHHPADAFTNPATWKRVTGTESVEIKPDRAMMGASEMRRYLKGRKDL